MKNKKQSVQEYKAKSRSKFKLTASRQNHQRQLQKEPNRKKVENQQNKETSYTKHEYSTSTVQKFREKVKIDFITPKEKKSLLKKKKKQKRE